MYMQHLFNFRSERSETEICSRVVKAVIAKFFTSSCFSLHRKQRHDALEKKSIISVMEEAYLKKEKSKYDSWTCACCLSISAALHHNWNCASWNEGFAIERQYWIDFFKLPEREWCTNWAELLPIQSFLVLLERKASAYRCVVLSISLVNWCLKEFRGMCYY